MRLLKLQKSGFVDFERLRKEPFGDNWRITFHLVHWGHIVIGVRLYDRHNHPEHHKLLKPVPWYNAGLNQDSWIFRQRNQKSILN